jgi:hypothetical protein
MNDYRHLGRLFQHLLSAPFATILLANATDIGDYQQRQTYMVEVSWNKLQRAFMAGRIGVDVSPYAINQRFTDATATLLHPLLASVQHVSAADPVAISIRFSDPVPDFVSLVTEPHGKLCV